MEDYEYVQNRDCRLKTNDNQKNEISRTYDFILAESQVQNLSASRIDIRCLAFGDVLDIPVVTDDTDMILLGQVFGIKMIKTVELLRLMLDEKYIDIAKVEAVAQYLIYVYDLPRNFKSDYKKNFGADPPVIRR